MRKSIEPVPPVVKVREVDLAIDDAFDLFTTGMGGWWPLATHSIAGERAADVRFEPRVGGRVVEIAEDGIEHEWADVIAWDPPQRFVVAWHPTPEPVASSILEVRFESTDGGCRLHLEHRGWEEFGLEAGTEARNGYDPGWDNVLDTLMASIGSQPQRVGPVG